MDVLAENGELFGQIAVALVEVVEAVAGADAPFRPAMEGVRAAAADGDVVAGAVLCAACRAGRPRSAGNAVYGRLRLGADFDHAFGDFKLDFAETFVVFQAAEQVGGAPRQVEIALRDQLQFEFDAQRQGLAMSLNSPRGFGSCNTSLGCAAVSVSPDLRRASRHSAGPASSMMAAAKSGRARAERPISGYRLAIS
jgi:hypothetical protein